MNPRADLLGRPIKSVRLVEPLPCVDDRDGRTLTLEDEYLIASNQPRQPMSAKDLEAWANEKGRDSYGRNYLLDLAELKRRK